MIRRQQQLLFVLGTTKDTGELLIASMKWHFWLGCYWNMGLLHLLKSQNQKVSYITYDKNNNWTTCPYTFTEDYELF